MLALGISIGIAALLAAVAYCIKSYLDTRVQLGQRDAALQVEQQHVAAQEAAREAERAQRAVDLNAKLQSATTPDDVARLLRDTFPGLPKAH